MERILKLITIDGPSASGKSSVSRALAKKLNWPWLSTGVFYRGIALVFIEKFLSGDSSKRDLNNFKNCFSVERSISNGQKFLNKADMGNRVFEGSVDMEVLLSLISEPNWKVLMDENRTRFVFKGEDLTGRVFSPRVSLMASHMSQIREVRQALLNPQRDCFEIERGLVAEGRDCGTVVFPKAPLKIYLTATEGTRGKRRYEQNRGNQRDDEEVEVNGGGETLSQILSNQEFRDRQDSTRRTAPLKPPEGSLVIDSTSLNMSQVVNQILAYARKLWDGL